MAFWIAVSVAVYRSVAIRGPERLRKYLVALTRERVEDMEEGERRDFLLDIVDQSG